MWLHSPPSQDGSHRCLHSQWCPCCVLEARRRVAAPSAAPPAQPRLQPEPPPAPGPGVCRCCWAAPRQPLGCLRLWAAAPARAAPPAGPASGTGRGAPAARAAGRPSLVRTARWAQAPGSATLRWLRRRRRKRSVRHGRGRALERRATGERAASRTHLLELRFSSRSAGPAPPSPAWRRQSPPLWREAVSALALSCTFKPPAGPRGSARTRQLQLARASGGDATQPHCRHLPGQRFTPEGRRAGLSKVLRDGATRVELSATAR